MNTSTNNNLNFSNDNNPPKKRTRKYKVLSGIGLAVAVFVALILYNKQYLLLYYANARYNDFKVGDKLYAKKWVVNETSQYGSYNLRLYRKIRPLNNEDIDEMNISLSEKALIKSNLNTSNKPAIMQCAFYISSDSLCKYKTAHIGNYTGSEILNVKYNDSYNPIIFFSTTTNKKALVKDEESSNTKLPSGYVYDEGPFYVLLFDVTHHELHQFRKIN